MNNSGGLCLHETELLCFLIASLWMSLFVAFLQQGGGECHLTDPFFSLPLKTSLSPVLYVMFFCPLLYTLTFFLSFSSSFPPLKSLVILCFGRLIFLSFPFFFCRGRGQVDMLRLQVQCTSGCKLKRIETRDSNGYLWASVGSRIITIVKRWKQPRCPIIRWVDKQNVVYPCNEILFNLKKQENSDIYYHMDEPWRYYAKWSKAGTQG